MRNGKAHGHERGFSLIEVLFAASIVAIGLLAVMSMFPTGYGDVVTSGGQSKATAYAEQKLEELKNQPFTPSGSGNDSFESAEYARTWTITQVPGTPAPNRLARIVVRVNWSGRGPGTRPQTVTLETMRAE